MDLDRAKKQFDRVEAEENAQKWYAVLIVLAVLIGIAALIIRLDQSRPSRGSPSSDSRELRQDRVRTEVERSQRGPLGPPQGIKPRVPKVTPSKK